MNLDYKLFYLLFAENSDAGDPASCCSIRHFLSLESARTVMKEGFAARYTILHALYLIYSLFRLFVRSITDISA